MNTTNNHLQSVSSWDCFDAAGAGLVSLLLRNEKHESMANPIASDNNTGLPNDFASLVSDQNQGPRGPNSSDDPPSQKSDKQIMTSTPELTATKRERHYVQHDYHDYSMMTPQVVEQFLEENERVKGMHECSNSVKKKRGGITETFPVKLHQILDQIEGTELSSILSWQPHGRAFIVHNQYRFVEEILARYFRQSKLTSFQRQLNLYGFFRITRGVDAGSYYNEKFLRGKPYLAKLVIRIRVKGTGFKASSNPEQEPKFYAMPFLSADGQPREVRALALNVPALHATPSVTGVGASYQSLHTAPARSFQIEEMQNNVINKNQEVFYDQNSHSAPDCNAEIYLNGRRAKRNRRNALGYARQWQSLAVPQPQQRKENNLMIDDPFCPNPIHALDGVREEESYKKDNSLDNSLMSASLAGASDILVPTPNIPCVNRGYNPYNYGHFF